MLTITIEQSTMLVVAYAIAATSAICCTMCLLHCRNVWKAYREIEEQNERFRNRAMVHNGGGVTIWMDLDGK